VTSRATRFGRFPRLAVGDPQRLALAGEGELAGEVAMPVLVDHPAHGGRVQAAADPVEDDLRDRCLPLLGLAARLEIDRLREAALLARDRLAR
jgi:hypothetical protein